MCRILSFAAYAEFHYLGEANSVCELQATSEGDYIVFKNAISNEAISEETLESSNQSIALWAFFRYFEILDKGYKNLLEKERGRKSPSIAQMETE